MQSGLDKYHSLPYRVGVGLMILNRAKNIFVAKRVDSKMDVWQMPQGGMHVGETPSTAAMREMREEIGCNNASIVAESKKWYCYDIPPNMASKLWSGEYKGQKQKWFLINFEGLDQDINLNTHNPEFSQWKWVPQDQLIRITIPFKKKLYYSILEEFKDYLK